MVVDLQELMVRRVIVNSVCFEALIFRTYHNFYHGMVYSSTSVRPAKSTSHGLDHPSVSLIGPLRVPTSKCRNSFGTMKPFPVLKKCSHVQQSFQVKQYSLKASTRRASGKQLPPALWTKKRSYRSKYLKLVMSHHRRISRTQPSYSDPQDHTYTIQWKFHKQKCE